MGLDNNFEVKNLESNYYGLQLIFHPDKCKAFNVHMLINALQRIVKEKEAILQFFNLVLDESLLNTLQQNYLKISNYCNEIYLNLRDPALTMQAVLQIFCKIVPQNYPPQEDLLLYCLNLNQQLCEARLQGDELQVSRIKTELLTKFNIIYHNLLQNARSYYALLGQYNSSKQQKQSLVNSMVQLYNSLLFINKIKNRG